ncbi:hypothetical protein LCGC14_1913630 [marine sediment metagenome]|uniref:Uncharacterized protein n=1 Tax=marine sediment metagenome TaxID=412755 RepID=A0A0F9I6X0_9ZZZZ
MATTMWLGANGDTGYSIDHLPPLDYLRRQAAIRDDAFKGVWVALAMVGVHYCGLKPWALPNPDVLAAMPSSTDREVVKAMGDEHGD